MGAVYRARDSRLDREVAVKVLPEHFAEEPERLERFEREAKALAALNHPNVAQIFGVDQADGTWFLVLELVPGETLEDRLKRGALPVDEALDVCGQVAAGLEAAHEAGIVHRDLKPANVRITPEGKVKVLDFGLAKPFVVGGGKGADEGALSTEPGRMIGTPMYMAPEQARGKPIDRRVDVWAFGCVLFECLTGVRAFAGETVSDVLAAVLEREPEEARLPSATPPRVRDLVQRCLTKDSPARHRRHSAPARGRTVEVVDLEGGNEWSGRDGRPPVEPPQPGDDSRRTRLGRGHSRSVGAPRLGCGPRNDAGRCALAVGNARGVDARLGRYVGQPQQAGGWLAVDRDLARRPSHRVLRGSRRSERALPARRR